MFLHCEDALVCFPCGNKGSCYRTHVRNTELGSSSLRADYMAGILRDFDLFPLTCHSFFISLWASIWDFFLSTSFPPSTTLYCTFTWFNSFHSSKIKHFSKSSGSFGWRVNLETNWGVLSVVGSPGFQMLWEDETAIYMGVSRPVCLSAPATSVCNICIYVWVNLCTRSHVDIAHCVSLPHRLFCSLSLSTSS